MRNLSMTLFEALAAVYARDIDVGARYTAPKTARDRAASLRADALSEIGAALGRWFAAVREDWQRRSATRALQRLDDRLLADIGVSRSEIPYLVVHGLDARPVNDDRLPVLAGCG